MTEAQARAAGLTEEQIAGMTHRRLGQPPYPMHTPDAWARRHEESIARGAANRAASLNHGARVEWWAEMPVLPVMVGGRRELF